MCFNNILDGLIFVEYNFLLQTKPRIMLIDRYGPTQTHQRNLR